jgi:hypothetical protein
MLSVPNSAMLREEEGEGGWGASRRRDSSSRSCIAAIRDRSEESLVDTGQVEEDTRAHRMREQTISTVARKSSSNTLSVCVCVCVCKSLFLSKTNGALMTKTHSGRRAQQHHDRASARTKIEHPHSRTAASISCGDQRTLRGAKACGCWVCLRSQ